MKQLTILGNWKANKTVAEAREWISAFLELSPTIPPYVSVVLCPSFIHLSLFLEVSLPISLGLQDVSAYPSGAYTGEVSSTMVSGSASYVLIGHSERRTNLHETDAVVIEKVHRCQDSHIRPVVCVSALDQVNALATFIPSFGETGMILYEPPSAIGSGKPALPEEVNEMAKSIKERMSGISVLYGGSVTPENVLPFYQSDLIDGIGVGGASLSVDSFFGLIQKASSL
ncbi:MAG: triose-phosphate isomerase family protein [bacterium]|nr:triose-phosphate isomerase family protein [bacterium]